MYMRHCHTLPKLPRKSKMYTRIKHALLTESKYAHTGDVDTHYPSCQGGARTTHESKNTDTAPATVIVYTMICTQIVGMHVHVTLPHTTQVANKEQELHTHPEILTQHKQLPLFTPCFAHK